MESSMQDNSTRRNDDLFSAVVFFGNSKITFSMPHSSDGFEGVIEFTSGCHHSLLFSLPSVADNL